MKIRSIDSRVVNILSSLQLTASEMNIYKNLMKKKMDIKHLEKAVSMSERMIRTCLDDLMKKNFVKRELIESKHLKYIYHANSSDSVLDSIVKKIGEMNSKNKISRKKIMEGSKI